MVGRKYGLTCDRVVSMKVVTPDGHLRTVSRVCEPELFWALRGGGGGNFGIVTSFIFRTAPATNMVMFSLSFPIQAWVRRLPPGRTGFLRCPTICRQFWGSRVVD
ncbi:hypothetical protein GCM10012275_30230 [Longimycelium tulufanense]|uniref:FAD-binding PCMH-type domain-containing protein n=1 Tax=Longimycelium tulufanense TaxID=907463 RepID=A0A8J3FVC8_9PSEU|nr:hypothetical protein GCM10012275_30230 [Longimycelium tulufanense]